jgi:O-methyltransferase
MGHSMMLECKMELPVRVVPMGAEVAMVFRPRLDELYLDLMKKCLTRSIFPDTHRPVHRPPWNVSPLGWAAYPLLAKILGKSGVSLYREVQFDPAARAEGLDWPAQADTMIGLKRLDNLHACIQQVIREKVPGDFIETGVWRGGACIFMRAALNAYADGCGRQVWLADSFEGLPKPDGRYRQDEGDRHWTFHRLSVSLDSVKCNFSRYGLLDDRVRFLQGWFKDTLPTAPIKSLAIMRLDGDMYSSTMDSLINLYWRLSVGGYVIIDDYGIERCRQAVDDFRASNQIETPLIPIDLSGGVFWRKTN